MDSAASYKVDVHAFPGQHLLLQQLEADLWGDHWSAPQGIYHVHLTSPAEGRASVALSDLYKHELVSTRKENPKMSLIFQGVVLRVQPQKKAQTGEQVLGREIPAQFATGSKAEQTAFQICIAVVAFPIVLRLSEGRCVDTWLRSIQIQHSESAAKGTCTPTWLTALAHGELPLAGFSCCFSCCCVGCSLCLVSVEVHRCSPRLWADRCLRRGGVSPHHQQLSQGVREKT